MQYTIIPIINFKLGCVLIQKMIINDIITNLCCCHVCYNFGVQLAELFIPNLPGT